MVMTKAEAQLQVLQKLKCWIDNINEGGIALLYNVYLYKIEK